MLLGRAQVQRDRGSTATAAAGLRNGIELLENLGGTEPQVAQASELLAEIEREALGGKG